MLQENSGHPVRRVGDRVIDCPLYSDCLMHAAKQQWNKWSCEDCPNFDLRSVREELKFIAPYFNLLSEIYPDFKRKYEPLMERLHFAA